MRLLVLIIAVPLFFGSVSSRHESDARLGTVASPNADTPAAGACKSVATFTSSALPELKKDGCTGCHGGAMANATTIFDLSKAGKDNTSACASALKKVDAGNKPQSAILQAATGAVAHPGGKVTDTQVFKTALLGWINNE